MCATPPFETERLLLREAERADLPDVHGMFASNPEFLALRDDIASYDLAAVTRYWEMATLDPDRHVLVIVDKEAGAPVGLVDFARRSPADGLPWIGLVMTHGHHQGRGVGTEAVRAVTDHLASEGHTAVRMAVVEGNEAGLEFARRVGFEAYGHSAAPMGTPGQVVLLELPLGP